jgi:hypothetical protein
LPPRKGKGGTHDPTEVLPADKGTMNIPGALTQTVSDNTVVVTPTTEGYYGRISDGINGHIFQTISTTIVREGIDVDAQTVCDELNRSPTSRREQPGDFHLSTSNILVDLHDPLHRNFHVGIYDAGCVLNPALQSDLMDVPHLTKIETSPSNITERVLDVLASEDPSYRGWISEDIPTSPDPRGTLTQKNYLMKAKKGWGAMGPGNAYRPLMIPMVRIEEAIRKLYGDPTAEITIYSPICKEIARQGVNVPEDTIKARHDAQDQADHRDTSRTKRLVKEQQDIEDKMKDPFLSDEDLTTLSEKLALLTRKGQGIAREIDEVSESFSAVSIRRGKHKKTRKKKPKKKKPSLWKRFRSFVSPKKKKKKRRHRSRRRSSSR